MSSPYSNRKFIFASFGCCVPTESYAWILITLFIFFVLVLLFCLTSTVIVRWVYKRRLRKKVESAKEKLRMTEQAQTKFESKLRMARSCTTLDKIPIKSIYETKESAKEVSKREPYRIMAPEQQQQLQQQLMQLQMMPQPPTIPVMPPIYPRGTFNVRRSGLRSQTTSNDDTPLAMSTLETTKPTELKNSLPRAVQSSAMTTQISPLPTADEESHNSDRLEEDPTQNDRRTSKEQVNRSREKINPSKERIEKSNPSKKRANHSHEKIEPSNPSKERINYSKERMQPSNPSRELINYSKEKVDHSNRPKSRINHSKETIEPTIKSKEQIASPKDKKHRSREKILPPGEEERNDGGKDMPIWFRTELAALSTTASSDRASFRSRQSWFAIDSTGSETVAATPETTTSAEYKTASTSNKFRHGAFVFESS